MRTAIYYFTGGGNSLAAARDLAERLDGALIPIPSVAEQDRVTTDAEVIGMVFPVYFASLGGSGIPFIVDRFARKLEGIASKYVFAVCTHQGMAHATLENLDRILRSRGGALAAGFAVKLSNPYSTAEKLGNVLFGRELVADSQKEAEKLQIALELWELKKDEILRMVQARETGCLETPGAAAKILLAPFMRFEKQLALSRYRQLAGQSGSSFEALVPLADRSFRVHERCTGCGICARVCPVGNIEMAGGKPVWQGHCEGCNACYYWCPENAIYGEIVKFNKRCHHPEVSLADMLRQAARETGMEG